MNHTASTGLSSPSPRQLGSQQLTFTNDVHLQTIVTPLYLPCLQPLKLCSGSQSTKRTIAPQGPLAPRSKRFAGKGRSMRCCRQLFCSDGSRAAAMEFWLHTMEKALARQQLKPAA